MAPPIEEGCFERPLALLFASFQSHCCRSSSIWKSPAFPVSLFLEGLLFSIDVCVRLRLHKRKRNSYISSRRGSNARFLIHDLSWKHDDLDRSTTVGRRRNNCLHLILKVSMHWFDHDFSILPFRYTLRIWPFENRKHSKTVLFKGRYSKGWNLNDLC